MKPERPYKIVERVRINQTWLSIINYLITPPYDLGYYGAYYIAN